MMSNLNLGQIVRSKAGRDKDRFYVVVGFDQSDKKGVLLADGKKRCVDKPKLKRIIHIAKTNTVDTILSDKLCKGEVIEDQMIRSALKSFAKD